MAASSLSAQQKSWLREDLKYLCDEAGGTPLAEAVEEYILTGESESVLPRVANKQSARALDVNKFTGDRNADSPRIQLLASKNLPAEVLLRLGKVFASAAAAGAYYRTPEAFQGAPWLDLLLIEATGMVVNVWPLDKPRDCGISVSLAMEMLQIDGKDPLLILHAPFRCGAGYSGGHYIKSMVASLPGFADCLLNHQEVALEALGHKKAEVRIHALEVLAEGQVPYEPLREQIMQLATSSAKNVREAAVPLLADAKESAQADLQELAASGSAAQRLEAVKMLARLCQEEAAPFLTARLQQEKSAKVKSAISACLLQFAPAEAAEAGQMELEPLPPLAPGAPVSKSLRDAFLHWIDGYNKAVDKENEKNKARAAKQGFKFWPIENITSDQAEETLKALGASDTPKTSLRRRHGALLPIHFGLDKNLLNLAEHPDLQLVQLVRFFAAVGEIAAIRGGDRFIGYQAEQMAVRYRRSHAPPISLRQLALALEVVGLCGDTIGENMLDWFGRRRFLWGEEQVEAYFLERLKLLEDIFLGAPGKKEYSWITKGKRHQAYRILSQFSAIPPSLLAPLWELALGSAKTERPPAQEVLNRVPGKEARILEALQSGKYETRAVAAEWLGRLEYRQAIEPLKAALKKEKHDVALAAEMNALERLGESIDSFLDRKQLHKDAEKGLKKGIPAALDWFAFDQLPAVRWQDTNKPVEKAILTWFLVQANKLKSPEPSPLLKRYCDLLAAADRKQLGAFVLDQWISRDLTRKYTDAEARKLAQQRNPQGSPYYDWTLEQLRSETFSVIKEKGLLAVAGACCGGEAATVVQAYLKEWYGYRAAQCKAMIRMLSAMDEPAAIQLLLSVANRFRTKGIREEAEACVRAVAERKNWTIDQLGDRTIPTAGFDEDGRLLLDFGPRQFTAEFDETFQLTLISPEGKPVKALPAPRKEDDEALAAAAKKTFATAKKELKQIVKLQTLRLYEALCTQRTWPLEEWRSTLQQHAIVRHISTQLVWGAAEKDAFQQTFRPLADGTFTSADDEGVELPENANIRLVHGCLVSQEAAAAWKQHLIDYEVRPPFDQFNRPAFEPTQQQEATELTDYEGYLIEAFALRNQATKFGFSRGPAEDGGWFYVYEKQFPGLGMKAEIVFSGNSLPEENRTVALNHLRFLQSLPEEAQGGEPLPVPLGDVPPVLLSECAGDLSTIAAAGSGFDADWQSKVE